MHICVPVYAQANTFQAFVDVHIYFIRELGVVLNMLNERHFVVFNRCIITFIGGKFIVRPADWLCHNVQQHGVFMALFVNRHVQSKL